jgi:hypothetical protein
MEVKIHSNIYKDKFCIIDEEDYEKVSCYRWNLTQDKKYAIAKIDNKIQTMHHYIFGKPPEGYVIDHINRNSFDNRKKNLRFATPSQNSQNIETKNKYRGVFYHKKENKYRTFCFGEHYGQFNTEEEAARQYDKVIIKKLGINSFLNFKYSEQEIKEILDKPLKEKRKKLSNLPLHITILKNKYRVRFEKKDYKVNSLFDTLEEAIEYRDKIIKEIENKRKNIIKQITYNSNGNAVIYINHKKEILECIVDEDKWHDLSDYNWSINNNKYAQSNTNGLKQKMHRYLFNKYVKNITHNEIIDHINHNRLDNRIQNLRIATHSENIYNRIIKNNSGYRGVSYDKKMKKYRAFVSKNLKTYRSGFFDTAEEAALAYDILAEEIYGNFALKNNVKLTKLLFID